MSMQEKDSGDLHAIDKRLAELDAEREQLLYRKQKILDQLKSEQPQSPLTTEDKISLFQKLFKGRADVFAVLSS